MYQRTKLAYSVSARARSAALSVAAVVLQALRQVPVVQRGVRADAAFEQAVDEALVEGQAGLVPGAVPQWLHARPRERETIGVHAQARHQRDVFGPASIVVASDVAGLATHRLARGVREGVPDRGAAAVGGGAAFDLVGAGGHAPGEILRQRGARPGSEGVETVQV